jgi:hypothetical protein
MRKTAIAIVSLMALFATNVVQASAQQLTSETTSRLELTAGKKKAKKAKKSKTAKPGGRKPTQVASAKSCGTYMYLKDGKCVDARAKK